MVPEQEEVVLGSCSNTWVFFPSRPPSIPSTGQSSIVSFNPGTTQFWKLLFKPKSTFCSSELKVPRLIECMFSLKIPSYNITIQVFPCGLSNMFWAIFSEHFQQLLAEHLYHFLGGVFGASSSASKCLPWCFQWKVSTSKYHIKNRVKHHQSSFLSPRPFGKSVYQLLCHRVTCKDIVTLLFQAFAMHFASGRLRLDSRKENKGPRPNWFRLAQVHSHEPG